MKHPFSLSMLLKNHRLTIVDVVILSVLESVLFVAQFYFIGKAINDLLKESWSGMYVLIALFVVKIFVSYVKQIRIGKTYKKIYDQLIVEAVGHPLSDGEGVETLAPKSIIIYEMASFFKGDLIKGFETIVRLFLVLIALFIFNKTVFLVALSLMVLVFLLYFFRKSKTIRLSQDMVDEMSRELQILKSGKTRSFFEHHKKLEKLDNDLLGISALNLSIIEVVSFAFVIIAMVFLVKSERENALGTFFAMLYYVMAFTETMFLLPSVYQNYLKIREASKKL